MKKAVLTFAAAVLFTSAFAQESESKFSINADLVSRYVWRGTQLGTTAIQPGVSYSTGGFTLGSWASYAIDGSGFGDECDLYASYAFDFGLGVVVNDYFFPNAGYDNSYFNYDDNHTLELGLTYATGGLNLAAYKYLNADEDLYVEASYSFKYATLFAGAGNENYSVSGDFNLVNLGLKVSKEVAISDKYSVSPFASFIVNPNREQTFLVVGVTL
ncbi:MAG: hypothetical protein QM786_17235 [Breznakibacter sp.]